MTAASPEPPDPHRWLAGVEAGGTKVLCAVSDGDGRIARSTRIPTTTPHETLTAAAQFFRDTAVELGPLAALGVASFGPLCLERGAEAFGAVLQTPKEGWTGADMLGPFRTVTQGPVVIDTDVNAAALAEHRFGAARGRSTFCYVTVGTGVGGGVFAAGAPHHGFNHPEIGHIQLARCADDHSFESVCPYHADCVEGLASGPALAKRWGAPAENLPADHPAWDLEARYLAALCANLFYTLSPERLILGGGVMEQAHMLERIRAAFAATTRGYAITGDVARIAENLIVSASVEPSAGLAGALAMAGDACAAARRD